MKFDNLVDSILKENHDLKLILIRGVSGSGKTTYAKKLIEEDPNLSHYEADMFFDVDGYYHFDPRQLKDAHSWCQARTEKDLKNGKSVIVSNTFTQKWEIEPYIELAKKYQANVIIKKMTGNYKNIHGVPDDVVERMKARWENVEGEENL
jgi:predicted kinase